MSHQHRHLAGHAGAALSLAFALSLALGGCHVGELTSVDGNAVVLDAQDGGWPAADWTLVEAALDGDVLEVRLQYPGGCAIHEFRLLTVGGWVELPHAGLTATVAIALRIAHDDHGDRCEALLTETLRFDLAPLRAAYRRDRGTGPARIILRLPVAQGADEVLAIDWII